MSLCWVSLCWGSRLLKYYAECRYAECLYAEFHYAECHYPECHYAECHCAECRDYLNVMLSVVILNVIMLSIIRLNVIMLSVVASVATLANCFALLSTVEKTSANKHSSLFDTDEEKPFDWNWSRSTQSGRAPSENRLIRSSRKTTTRGQFRFRFRLGCFSIINNLII